MIQLIVFLTFNLLFSLSDGFLFGGGGGCNQCCPPPIPCNCVPQQPAPACPCAAKARDEKTVTAQPLDELELRARVSGIQLDQQPTHGAQIVVPRQLELLERLGDDSRQPQLIARRLGPPQAQSYFSSPNVRFSPQQSPKDQSPASSVDEETPEKVEMIDQSTTPEPLLNSEEHVSEEDRDIKCNSQVLKKLMIDKMTDNSATSKRQINTEAEKIFGGSIDVICSRGHFSYIYSSSLFCEASKGDVTCIAFRQTK